MPTDPALPGILATAAGRVDRVGEQLISLHARLVTTGVSMAFGWSGTARRQWSDDLQVLMKRTTTAARATASLAATLRAASGTATQRLQAEAAAAAAARKKAEEAARQAAAARRAGGTR